MERKHESIQRRAVKAGIREARKRHHALSEEELLGVRVQVLPALLRIIVGAAGAAMIAAALAGWPVDTDSLQVLIGIGGLLLVLFAIYGVRRTLGGVLDNAGGEVVGEIVAGALASIAESVDS